MEEQLDRLLEMGDTVVLGNPVTLWVVALGLFVASLIVARLLRAILRRIQSWLSRDGRVGLRALMVEAVERPAIYIVILTGLRFAMATLELPQWLETGADGSWHLLLFLGGAWALTRVFDALFTGWLVPLLKRMDDNIDEQLLSIVRSGIKISVWIMAVIVGLDNMGVDVVSILAGLGIGGLALALAAQDSVSNIFGGINVFLDRPFAVGDRIQLLGLDGDVLEIGLRSTRIESRYEGRIITIPNSKVANAEVVNVSSESDRGGRQMFSEYRLSPTTSPDKIEEAIEILKAVATESEGTQERVITGLRSISEYSYDVMLLFWVKPDASNGRTRTAILLEILRRFEAAGIEMVKVQPVHAKVERLIG